MGILRGAMKYCAHSWIFSKFGEHSWNIPCIFAKWIYNTLIPSYTFIVPTLKHQIGSYLFEPLCFLVERWWPPSDNHGRWLYLTSCWSMSRFGSWQERAASISKLQKFGMGMEEIYEKAFVAAPTQTTMVVAAQVSLWYGTCGDLQLKLVGIAAV